MKRGLTNIRKAKHKIMPTSLLAYAEVLDNLCERQAQAYGVIRSLKSCNNQMICNYLHLPINSITPRVNELRKLHIVMMDKKDICPYTKKMTCFWRVRREL